ncbi:MAG: glycosyltransferase family 2 protein [Anaerolineae bacterium]|nr:glycosyltransferase family 2 protein [Anaerolineae bacterium]
MAVQLAVVILTKNEARHIGECLATLGFADAVVLSDSYSDDGTVEIARAAGATIFQRPFDNFAGQRNAALEAVEAEWVFFVDADERITPELAAEVRQVIGARPEVGWWVPRHNFIAGHPVRHGGFYPDYQLRLLRRDRARYDPDRPVHEVVLLDGPAGYLQNPMIHYNYASWAQFHAKQRRYARMEGRILRERGVRPWPHKFVRQPLREFWRRYVTLEGYKDGWVGLKLAVLLGFYYGFMPHWYLWRD